VGDELAWARSRASAPSSSQLSGKAAKVGARTKRASCSPRSATGCRRVAGGRRPSLCRPRQRLAGHKLASAQISVANVVHLRAELAPKQRRQSCARNHSPPEIRHFILFGQMLSYLAKCFVPPPRQPLQQQQQQPTRIGNKQWLDSVCLSSELPS